MQFAGGSVFHLSAMQIIPEACTALINGVKQHKHNPASTWMGDLQNTTVFKFSRLSSTGHRVRCCHVWLENSGLLQSDLKKTVHFVEFIKKKTK